MFEKVSKYITVTALLVLLTAGFVAALRPGITIVKDTGLIDGQVPAEEAITGGVAIAQVPQLIGGQTDSHGCLGPAGFSWNETRKQCVREFSGEVQLASGTMLVNTSDPNWREKLQASIPISTDVKCISSNGNDIFTKRTVMEYGKNPRKSSCIRHRILRTWACSGDVAVQKLVICKKGCTNEACRPEVTTTTLPSTTTTLPKVALLGPPITIPEVPENSTI